LAGRASEGEEKKRREREREKERERRRSCGTPRRVKGGEEGRDE
jgi:hypothetical protein